MGIAGPPAATGQRRVDVGHLAREGALLEALVLVAGEWIRVGDLDKHRSRARPQPCRRGQAKLLDDICVADSGHPVVVVTDGEEIVGFVSFTIDASQRTGEIGLNAVRLTMRGETSARTCTSTS